MSERTGSILDQGYLKIGNTNLDKQSTYIRARWVVGRSPLAIIPLAATILLPPCRPWASVSKSRKPSRSVVTKLHVTAVVRGVNTLTVIKTEKTVTIGGKHLRRQR